MLERLRNQIGTAGLLVAIVALVAALGGGAYAATSNSGKATASAKQGKQGKQGKPGKTGPAGPTGPQGPAGPAGAKGDKGDTGATGATGAQGPAGPAGATGPAGKNGTTGFTKTLPAGETETGAWSFGTFSASGGTAAGTAEGVFVPISFPIPLEAGLGASQVHYINKAGKEVILAMNEKFEFAAEEVDQPSPQPCPGTASLPEAEPGELCVYEGKLEGPVLASNLIGNPAEGSYLPFPSSPNLGAGATGALLNAHLLNGGAPIYGWGTWAVTAE